MNRFMYRLLARSYADTRQEAYLKMWNTFTHFCRRLYWFARLLPTSYRIRHRYKSGQHWAWVAWLVAWFRATTRHPRWPSQ